MWKSKFYGAFVLNHIGRAIAEKRLSEELSGAPDALVDFHCSDIRLRQAFLTPLILDFQTYAKALHNRGGSNNKRALLLDFHGLSKPDWADDGGEADDDGSEVDAPDA